MFAQLASMILRGIREFEEASHESHREGKPQHEKRADEPVIIASKNEEKE